MNIDENFDIQPGFAKFGKTAYGIRAACITRGNHSEIELVLPKTYANVLQCDIEELCLTIKREFFTSNEDTVKFLFDSAGYHYVLLSLNGIIMTDDTRLSEICKSVSKTLDEIFEKRILHIDFQNRNFLAIANYCVCGERRTPYVYFNFGFCNRLYAARLAERLRGYTGDIELKTILESPKISISLSKKLDRRPEILERKKYADIYNAIYHTISNYVYAMIDADKLRWDEERKIGISETFSEKIKEYILCM